MPGENESIVNAFIREWDSPRLDAEKLAAYFTEDAVYQNMPTDPLGGRAAITAALAAMGERLESGGWDVLRQLASGDIVMNERVDHFRAGGRSVDLPVMGIFELRDGKIAAWRDYWDMGTWQKQLQG